MSQTCMRLENLNQELLSDLHIYSHTNRVNILWDQDSSSSICITGLKQKIYVNLPSLAISTMLPRYNGQISLVLLKTQPTKKKTHKKHQPKPEKMWSYITKEEKMPHSLRPYSGTILPKPLKHTSLLEDVLVLCSQWQFFSTGQSRQT